MRLVGSFRKTGPLLFSSSAVAGAAFMPEIRKLFFELFAIPFVAFQSHTQYIKLL